MPLERKKTLNVFKEAGETWGSYDDYPVGPAGTDPMPHLSRNRVAQPFFLVSEEDQVLITMSGRGVIEFKTPEPERMSFQAGDAIYLPACVPSRVIPDGETLQLRLKAEPPAREAVAWYCASCGALVHSRELAAGIAQEQYWNAANEFNTEVRLRTCACGAVHPPAELTGIAWPTVAAALRADS